MTLTGICRVSGSCFRRSRTAHPSMSGSFRSSVIASGASSLTRTSAVLPSRAITPLKPLSRATSSSVAANFASSSTIRTTRSPGWMFSRSSLTCGCAGAARPAFCPRLVGERQVKRERAAFARSAFDPDFPAKQARELAADGKSQSRAAVFAAGGPVSLLEGFENDLPLVFWDSDPGVRHGKRRHFFRRIQLRVPGGPSGFREGNPQIHFALFGKLDRIREQILQDLLEPLFVGVNHRVQAGGRVHREPQALVLSDLAEGPLDVVPQPGEAFGRNVEGDGTRFDLGQIENIVDEGKEIG